MKLNKIYNKDCLVGMKDIPDKSIDMLLTDPPYNISVKNNFKTMGRNGIDFGDWDKNFDLTSWIGLAVSKIKSGGNIVIFCDWKMITYIVDELTTNGCDVKDMIRLVKTTLCLEIETEDLSLIMKWQFGRLKKENGLLIDYLINTKYQRLNATSLLLVRKKSQNTLHKNR